MTKKTMNPFVVAGFVFFYWVLMPSILYGSGFLLDAFVEWTSFHGMQLFGIMLCFFSLGLTALSIGTYWKATGLPPISAYPPDAIIRNGIYATFRHPIYLFFSLSLAGGGFIIGSRAFLFFVFPVYCVAVFIFLRMEEKKLLSRFGPTYRAHMEQTGILLPRFHQFVKIPLLVFSLFCFPLKVTGRDNVPKLTPFFIVSSHRDYLDPFMLGLVLPYRIRFLTTFDMFRTPLLTTIFRSFGSIPRRRYRSDPAGVRETSRALAAGSVIGLFPEGERSFTGVPLSFKREAVELLLRNRNIPILPVAISGNYFLWPRWGKRICRTPVRIDFRKPMLLDSIDTVDIVRKKLWEAVKPDDAGFLCRSGKRAEGIERILYRCPVCESFDSFRANRSLFLCTRCDARFNVSESFLISREKEESLSIASFYNATKIKAADLRKLPFVSGPALFRTESGKRMKFLFKGIMKVTSESVILAPNAISDSLTLSVSDITAATIESWGKLQLYDGKALFQAEFENESARKWQDIVALVCTEKRGREITVR